MLRAFVDQLPRLRAERQLAAIEAASVPYMKPDDARDVFDRYQRVLNAGTHPDRGPGTEVALELAGFRVRHVPRKEEPDG